ncbi:electron transfer flavoprotein subunit alpha/FixB family protein [Tropicimonas sp. TH_r6]|uniref:electron transfer flavoprotein subunit alpha/FixB family protein n=1 Tax=Tropicimonas sp. TH_r6 TaxID=3082085 RepID=UPI0029543B1A|nr:electron transfer flavoprotein subunit alpha/FixB family protein [Tropicimonas sp. TH_r6]MDV7142545.1 electron transfer flavoprotein subunit alpha/FixB family protein [Tropicimonas sp. TH_r6]
MRRVLVIAEQAEARVTPDLLEAARCFAGDAPCESFALVASGDAAALSGWLDTVVSVPAPGTGVEAIPALVRSVAALHREFGFACILMPGSQWGSMLAPRLAARIEAALIPEVREITRSEQSVRFLRRVSRNGDLAVIETVEGAPAVVTLQPRVFSSSGKPDRTTRFLDREGQGAGNSGIRLLRKTENTEQDIRDADVLVSAGAGVGRRIDELKPLADALGGQVSASRSLVNQGIAPRRIQVGQSGKTVAPRLYMAMGIHGASQHVAALAGAETIICVNTNAKAPLCSLADMVVVGDAVAFAQDLLRKIKEEQENATD